MIRVEGQVGIERARAIALEICRCKNEKGGWGKWEMRGDCTQASRSKREGEETEPFALNLCLGAGARGRVRATIMRRARAGSG